MSSGKILIIEDEVEVADLLAFNLEKAGFRTVTARDGLTGCRLVQPEAPDLILLDLMLPDLEGWEICRMLRGHEDPAVAEVAILMLTARSSAADRVRGLELGADDYLTKPFSVREVVLRSQALVDRRRSTRNLRREVETLAEKAETAAELQHLLFHEIRNKMLVIGGFSNRLARSENSPSDPKAAQYVSTIHKNSRYLGDLAEQVLMLGSLEDSELAMPGVEIDMGALFAAIADLHGQSAEARGIHLSWEVPDGCTAGGSKKALRICLSNLVENSLKYCPSGSAVTILARNQARGVTVEVIDDGPGIPTDEQEKVFQRFYRGRRDSSSTQGTGLGLYIVQTLARAMGADVTLRSRPGDGTRVTLWLPSGGSQQVLPDPSPSQRATSLAPDGGSRPPTSPAPP